MRSRPFNHPRVVRSTAFSVHLERASIKTTWLASSVRSTAMARGASKVVVCSFTKTAAKEVAGRGLPIPDNQIGTLHSLAYRSIESPPVAAEHIDDWNAQFPAMELSGGKRTGAGALDEPDAFTGTTEGDKLMSMLEVARARMLPVETLPLSVQAFAQRWTQWKKDEGYVDFSDMIEAAIERSDTAPGQPEIIYADEVQDFTPLELRLLRHWGKRAEKVIICGDDDQSLFSFKGSTPDAFLDPPLPDSQKKVLSQSYRVPVAVHAVANTWIQRLTRREPKEYLPRDAEGLVRKIDMDLGDTFALVREIRKQTEQGRSVMLLATCAYMLDPMKHAMRDAGLPFANRYRPSRSDWNPLRGNGRGVSTVDRLLAYLIIDERMFGEASRLWTGGDVKRWTHLVKKQGVFRRGATGAIGQLPDRELAYEEIASLFDDETTLEQAVTPDLDWLKENLLAASKVAAAYPIKVVENFGGQALLDDPLITLGTIHSTKGGQADVTYLSPDLSMAGLREWETDGESKDAIIRAFYVGMTRAREELVFLGQSNNVSVDVGKLTGETP